jgi:hypothetical protein
LGGFGRQFTFQLLWQVKHDTHRWCPCLISYNHLLLLLPTGASPFYGLLVCETTQSVEPRHNDFQWREVDPRWNAGELTRNQHRMLPPQQRATRRATMSASRTLFLGMAGHQDTMAVASVAQEHGAEVTSLGTLATRQGDLEQRIRQLPSQATHLIFVSEAGPCGDWLSRYRRTQDDDGWGVAPWGVVTFEKRTKPETVGTLVLTNTPQ